MCANTPGAVLIPRHSAVTNDHSNPFADGHKLLPICVSFYYR